MLDCRRSLGALAQGPRRVVLLSACLALVAAASAGVTVAPVFSSRMVVQRDRPIPVWGTALPGEQLAVSLGDSRVAVTAGRDGRWMASLPARGGSAVPVRLTVTGSGTNVCVLEDILVGDVWLAAGQSNMDMALFWSVAGKAEAAQADFPGIRFLKIPTVSRPEPQAGLTRKWCACTPRNAPDFTEVGYYFARQLHARLGVPIGIINSSWGGTPIESWLAAPSLAADPAGAAVQQRWQTVVAEYPAKLARYEAALKEWEGERAAAKAANKPFNRQAPFKPNGPDSQYMPSSLYNAMIHPLIPFALRGVIWYQGENNARRPEEYRTLFPSLIRSWRAAFESPDLPFFWVQLPNYNAGADADWPGLRAAQAAALALPHTGQAVTIDIGESGNVHPHNKAEVARRLALIAFARCYGVTNLVESGPVLDSTDFSSRGGVRIRFTQVSNGLKCASTNAAGPAILGGFEVAGDDGKFTQAQARLDDSANCVWIQSAAVPAPVAVRYAWRNDPHGLNLVNSAGLPAAPFLAWKKGPVPASAVTEKRPIQEPSDP